MGYAIYRKTLLREIFPGGIRVKNIEPPLFSVYYQKTCQSAHQKITSRINRLVMICSVTYLVVGMLAAFLERTLHYIHFSKTQKSVLESILSHVPQNSVDRPFLHAITITEKVNRSVCVFGHFPALTISCPSFFLPSLSQ